MSRDSQTVVSWLTGKPPESLTRQVERIAGLPGVRRIALMPDLHEGSAFPQGLAVATTGVVYPELVGADIGCGLSAIRLCGPTDRLDRRHLEELLPAMHTAVPTLKHPTTLQAPELPAECRAEDLSHSRLQAAAEREGRLQLGSLGRGNHFIEIDRDENGNLWILVHTGSRAMGQAITRHHLAQAAPGRKGGPVALDVADEAGRAYKADQAWAVRYAATNRLAIVNRIADLLEARHSVLLDEESWIDCPHNFARVERYGGEELVVHRKSANSAAAGEPGIIAGSMASGARIVRGLGNADALATSSHGAGRIMSRGEAASRIAVKDMMGLMEGVVFDRAHAAGFLDEAPQVYRDLDRVMRAQADLVKTVTRLVPVLNDKR